MLKIYWQILNLLEIANQLPSCSTQLANLEVKGFQPEQRRIGSDEQNSVDSTCQVMMLNVFATLLQSGTEGSICRGNWEEGVKLLPLSLFLYR